MNGTALKRAAIGYAAVVLVIGTLVTTQTTLCDRVLSGGPGPVPGPVPAPPRPTIAPAADLKIAFIGDSGASATFEQVLELVRAERADAVVHLGDAVYGEETSEQFWAVVDRVLGHDFPYFLAQGNHDDWQWPALALHARGHARRGGAEITADSATDPRFALVFKGVSFVFLGHEVNDDDPRYVIERFSRDSHAWKICAWHKNQEALQLGGKGDQMGWGVYESCRQMGAIIQTGHEHSYQRTRTLTSTILQTVDRACGDANKVCVRPGAVPVFVSGLGGRSIREQRRCLPTSFPYGCKGEWAFAYTASQGARFGALFITFNRGGGPKKAHGIFKTTLGQVVDEFDLVAP
jgi:hypothetical protein